MSNLSVNLEAKLVSDKETEDKIKKFTEALSELPRNLTMNFAVSINGKEGNGDYLTINVADLLVNQVKNHFGK